MPNKQPDLNLFGLQLTAPDNPGTWIGKLWRAKLCAILTCLLKPKFTIPIDNGNGIPVPQDAVVTMGRNGWTVVFPALAAAGSSGGGGSSTVTTYQITAIGNSDYFTAQTWDGTTLGGADVLIAKKIDFRESLVTETVDGVTITHTFSDDNHRTSNDGTNNQDEVCWPRFVVGAEIQAAQCSNATPVLDGGGKPIEWIDLTERVWLATD